MIDYGDFEMLDAARANSKLTDLSLTFETLTLDEFSSKRQSGESRYFFRSGHEGIKYFSNPWCLGSDREDYTYFVCTGSPRDEFFHGEDLDGNAISYTDTITPVLGIAELQVNPYDRSVIWLKYVSVAEGFHGLGIGRTLATQIATFMKSSGLKLSRSASNELAKERGFQKMMSDILNKEGVNWTQTES